jgi:valyl-tRNA synthetase
MHDWCISRQLWWGHRIPVWYGPDGEVVCVGPGEQPPSGAGWHQDADVLDTWFSSALWPFSTLGWPDDTPDLRVFYPTSVLVTGYDILFFWVARMMMFGLYAMSGADPQAAVPFRTVALHGLVRDAYGKKMSKSRGNTVDPLDWIDRFGADATRFTLARGASPGSDVAVSEEWAAGARNFCNKLWNAARFALLNGADAAVALPGPAEPGHPALPAADRWILSRLAAVTAEVDGLFEQFELGKACEALYHFAWDEFCDWYLELAKVPLSGDDPAAAATTRAVLGHTLDRLLRLIHPVMPFITDELWTHLTGGDSVMVAAWPGALAPGAREAGHALAAEPQRDPAAEAEIEALMRLVTQVRRFRSDQGLRPAQPVPAVLAGIGGTPLAGHEAGIRSLLRLAAPGADFAPTASVQAEGITVQLDTAAAIDIGAERRRLEKDLSAATADAAATERRLATGSFVERAPEAVVARSRDRLAAAQAEIASLEERLAALPPSS